MHTHYVKVRERGRKTWKFLANDGTTRLRVHALRFSEASANKLIDDNAADNPEWEFKTVPAVLSLS